MYTHRRFAVLVLAAALSLAACGGDDDADSSEADSPPANGARPADPGSDPVGLNLIGTSGNEIVINRLWVQGCLPGINGIDWQDSRRVLVATSEPYQLVTTLTDYQNESPNPDCENGRVGSSTFTQKVSSLGREIPFEWVDAVGNLADAPDGLDSVSMGNVMQGLMTEASVTPETQSRVDGLNQAEFCGVTEWQVNQTQDALLCFNGGFEPAPGSALLVIDDRTLPWKNYQSAPTSEVDADGFPTQVPNVLPFEGPFEP